MREEVVSSVGPQDLDTNSYQLTDLEDIEFNWENSQLDSVFRPGIDTPFSPFTSDDLSMERSVENLIVLDEEEDKESSASTTTSVSELPTENPIILSSCGFRARIKNVPDYIYRKLFQ